ncbi:MAG TPA: hypothetical protein VL485_29425 [Ktedonobacteraceae bacterium]|nr:hypothetical protein [Ktedonobacteraceae bacterium]
MPKQVPMQPEAKQRAKQVKRLRKREQRLLGRLEEAQERYESALARLHRAEVRLQKRQERVERLNGRLALLRQQLQAAIDPDSDAIPSEVSALKPDVTGSESIPSKAAEPAQEEATEQEAAIPSLLSVDGPTVEPAEKEVSVIVVDVAEPEQLAEVYSEYEEVVLAPADIPAMAEQPESAEPLEPVERDLVASLVGEKGADGHVHEEEESEMVLVMSVELPEPVVSTPSVVEQPEEEQSVVLTPSVEQAEEEQQVSIKFASQRTALLGEARAIAEMAEQAAYIATTRASHMLAHLEQMLDGRHLFPELELLQTESATLSSLAHDAQHTVDSLMQLSEQGDQEKALALVTQEIELQRQTLASIRMNIDFSESVGPAEPEEAATEDESEDADSLADLDLSEDEVVFDLPANALIHSVAEHAVAQAPLEELAYYRTVPAAPPFPLAVIEQVVAAEASLLSSTQEEACANVLPLSEEEQLQQLDEEEKEVETVAAMIVADVAAAAAAEAEALAEACGIHTRNAYTIALQADQALAQLQSAIQNGTFAAGEAQMALQLAERAATEAHAALADAEAAEEEAVSAAINAEAEAEVAEGMAFATYEQRDELHESPSTASRRPHYRGTNGSHPVRDGVPDASAEPVTEEKIPPSVQERV